MEDPLESSSLFDSWTTFVRRLRGVHVCILADYDGTLAPSADGAAERLPDDTVKQL